MRQSREAKAESHEAILAEAARLFRERGIAQTSVAEIMQAAALTHGGFYRHFASKDELAAAALAAIFAGIVGELETVSERESPRAAVEEYVATYLSDDHVRRPGLGCPIPALGTEAGRLGGTIAGAAAAGIAKVIDALASRLPGPKQTARARAAQLLATLVGAIVIARATEGEAIGREVLTACRERLGL
jgi:TetR/AcrR family transcriptional regulator, transcriptional repressor for nem operon